MKKPLHIIIDGADGLGKTTVCNILSNWLGLPVIKMPNTKEYIEDGNVEEMSRFFNDTVAQFDRFPFIMDRGFPSSIIYSEVFKRFPDLSYLKEWESRMSPFVVVLTGMRFRGDDVYEDKVLDTVDETFRKVARERGWKIVRVDGKNAHWVANDILDLIEENHE